MCGGGTVFKSCGINFIVKQVCSEERGNFTDLFIFRLIGAIVTLSPEYCFVVEDDDGVMGYAVAALDAKVLKQRQQIAWTPVMQEKYPKPERCTELTPAEVCRSKCNLQTCRTLFKCF